MSRDIFTKTVFFGVIETAIRDYIVKPRMILGYVSRK